MNTRLNKIWVFAALLLVATSTIAKDKDGGGDGGSSGMVIFDMTANPGELAISTNLDFLAPGGKGDTAIKDGYGINAINIGDFHVLSRDATKRPNELKLDVGSNEQTVSDDNFGTENANQHFSSGQHLFDLDRLRTASAAIETMVNGGEVTVDSGRITSGTQYGQLSFRDFLENIYFDRTMYGIIRLKVPLKLGTCDDDANCSKNALGQDVDKSTIYGFCPKPDDRVEDDGLCSCAPYDGYKIIEGDLNCSEQFTVFDGDGNPYPEGDDELMLPDTSQITVYGSLLWDFVASETQTDGEGDILIAAGETIPLSLLPWAPRELYFKVEIPINVNPEHDADGDGAMDNMHKIEAVSLGKEAGNIAFGDGEGESTPISYDDVPAVNKDEFEYYTGQQLTRSLWNGELTWKLDDATKYHLLMPNGYAVGWEKAFAALGIGASDWTSIDVDPKFSLPEMEGETITADDIRSPRFEDIPTYLYSGGLIDMHDHVNISGLVYVPQGMELEAKNSSKWDGYVGPTRQYVNGAIVVRDTFYIEAKATTITVISSEPVNYSAALANYAQDFSAAAKSNINMFRGSAFDGVTGGSGDDDEEGGPIVGGGPSGSCSYGCTGTAASAGTQGENRWMEIRPQSDAEEEE